MDSKFYVAVTAIIIKDNRVLITRRHPNKKKWPGKWTVPGGKVSTEDFLGTPTEINNQWYNTLINAVRREVREEVGLEIENIRFLCDIAVPDTIIVSFTADWSYGDVVLQQEETDAYHWISVEELDNYDIIDGIPEEIKSCLIQEKAYGH